MTPEELKETLRLSLISRFKIRKALEDDTALFSSGLIDSLNVIELVSFIEERLGCRVPPEEITLENFDSVRRIVQFALKSGAISGHMA